MTDRPSSQYDMALVQSSGNSVRRNNRGSPLNYMLPAIAGITSRAVDSATRQVVNNLMQQKTGQNGGANNISGTSGNRSGGGRRKRRRGGGGGRTTQTASQQGTFAAGGPLSTFRLSGTNNRSLSLVLRGTGLFSNNTVNTYSTSLLVGFSAASSTYVMSILANSDRSLLSAFTFFKIRKMTVRMAGNQGANAIGYLAMGYTDSVTSPTAPTYQDIQNCRSYNVVSLNSNGGLDVTLNAGPYYLNDTTQDVMHRAAGTLLLYSTNGFAQFAQIATFEMTFDVTVW